MFNRSNILATNQNALAKVHQTICTFSKANKVSALEKTIKFTDFKTANASEKMKTIIMTINKRLHI